jgi:hypothetical protein
MWLIRFDGDGRRREFTERWMEKPHDTRRGEAAG